MCWESVRLVNGFTLMFPCLVKKQRHNLTHVEIMLGDGEKTIGARWNDGKVQFFDSYKFTSKSYHSQIYTIKSLDPWLRGICQRYVIAGCTVHQRHRQCCAYAAVAIYSSMASFTVDIEIRHLPLIDKQSRKHCCSFAPRKHAKPP